MKKCFAEIEDNFCGLLLFVMAILTCINVFARYILHSSMPFVEELTCVGLVIISVGGAATAAKRGAHLGLTLFTDMMPKKAQIVCQIVGNLLGIAFGAVLVYFGFLMAQQEYVLGQKTTGMQWPEWLYGMWIPICGAVLIIRYLQLTAKELKAMKEEN